jgi:Zn-dependent protease with chaperone function
MTGIEEARTYLPWWVVWGPLVVRLPLVFLSSLGIAWLAGVISAWPLRGAKDLSWAERARLAYPVRQVAVRVTVLLCVLPAFLTDSLGGQLCPMSNGLLTILTGMTGYFASAIVFFFAERLIRQGRLPFSAWARGLVVYWLFFAPVLLIALFFVPFMPDTFNITTFVLFAIAVGVVIFSSVGGGLLIGRIVGLIRPAPEHLRDLVEEVARQRSVRVRAVYVFPSLSAQALAWPALKCVAFSSTALEILNDEELSAVTAHELAHLTESRSMMAGRMAFLLPLLPLLIAVPLVKVIGLLFFMGILLVGIILASRFSLRLSQSLERRADRIALEKEKDSGIFASVLEKIHESNLIPVVEPGQGLTHPHLYDRLVAAGSPPEYSRPNPPNMKRVRLSFTASLILMCCLWLGISFCYLDEGSQMNAISVAALNGPENDLSSLAHSAWSKQNIAKSAAFYRAASETNLTRVDLPANAALTLAYLDRLEEAEQFVHEAERRLAAGGGGNQQQIDNAWDAIRMFRQLREFRHQVRPRRITGGVAAIDHRLIDANNLQ